MGEAFMLARFWFALLCVTCIGGLAQAQYVPVRIVSEGDLAPGSGEGIFLLGFHHCVNDSGEVAIRLVDQGPNGTTNFYWIDGVDAFRAGLVPQGSTAPINNLLGIQNYSQLQGTDFVWRGADDNGSVLLLNDTALLFDGDAAPGIPLRTFTSFNAPCLTGAGGIYFIANLDGSVTDDEAIYYIPPGGTPELLETLGGSPFREGAPILGGPLDGMSFNDSGGFLTLEANAAGTLIMEAEIEAETDAVILKPLGGAYQLLLRQGDMITPPNGGMAPVDRIDQIAIARGSDYWAIDARLDDEVIDPELADFVLVDVGTGPQIIFQQGEDVSALTGVPGTTLGFFGEVNLNSNGKVVLIANVEDNGVDLIPYDEAIFLWDAGTKSLVLTDEIVTPGAPDLLNNIGIYIAINDQDRIFFQGDQGDYDALFEAILPSVSPVANLACQVVGNQVTANWDLGQSYTGIRILLDGVPQVPDLPGTATSYITPPLSASTAIEIEVIGLNGSDQSPGFPCWTSFIVAPDFEACLDFAPFVDVPGPATSTNMVTFNENVVIEDAAIEVQIGYTTLGLRGINPLEVTSPEGTTVRLHDGVGLDESLRAIYSDAGRPNGVPFDATDLMQVQGPGSTSDWKCENASGDWTFFLQNIATQGFPTLERYCVRVNEETLPGLDCCDGPSAPSCSSAGICGTSAITVNWTLNGSPAALELLRDDGSMITAIPLAPTDTSFTDTSVVLGATYSYELRYICAPGGSFQSAGDCLALNDDMLVPEVTNLECTNDFCNNEVTIAWDTNGVAHDMITLNRDGVFLADVTGMTSFVDTTPVLTSVTYSVVVNCGGSTAQTECVAEPGLAPPANLACAADVSLCDGIITLTWDNSASYATLDLFRNGVLVAPGVAAGDMMFVDGPLAAGVYTYDLVAGCNSTTAMSTCTARVSLPPTGTETDLILALESESQVDSVAALQNALIAAGREVYVAYPEPDILNLGCGVDPATFDNVWSMGGTFPDDYRHSVLELNYLASLAHAGIRIYFESADHWGFQHIDSDLDELDGIEQEAVADGDNTFTSMDGLDSEIGLNLLADFGGDVGPDLIPGTLDDIPGAIYRQDQSANDFTDRLSVNGTTAGVSLDAEVLAAGAIWQNNFDGDSSEYITGVYAITAASRMISTTWEFGGFNLDPLNPGASAGDRQLLAQLYLDAFAGDMQPRGRFIRGDANRDGANDIADAVYLLGFLFPGSGSANPLLCLDAADANADGEINIADGIGILGSLFSSSPFVPPPPNIFTGCGEAPLLGCLANTPPC